MGWQVDKEIVTLALTKKLNGDNTDGSYEIVTEPTPFDATAEEGFIDGWEFGLRAHGKPVFKVTDRGHKMVWFFIGSKPEILARLAVIPELEGIALARTVERILKS